MDKIKIHELAKKLGKSSKEIIEGASKIRNRNKKPFELDRKRRCK